MITDSMLQSQQMPEQMDILKHVTHQNKMLKQQADLTLARLHNKKEGLHRYIQMKRSENYAY
ncbi:hypothetical protein, partial [Salmonella sp. s51228]|uniref:hypothetical protein n=1 Tax=Salmonella sp. s51228 TaxID=3159652 RepID=UPI0039814EC4